jgi:hypothetical protein
VVKEQPSQQTLTEEVGQEPFAATTASSTSAITEAAFP